MDLRKILAFFSVYVLWGSTYLAIRYGIETIPPWALSSIRNCIAGLIVIALSVAQRESRLSRHELQIAVLSGGLLVLANGFVNASEAMIPSGVVAVIIGAMPIWIMMISWLFFAGDRPSLRETLGAVIGVSGVAMIAQDSLGFDGSAASVLGMSFVSLSSCSWAIGTLMQRKVKDLKSFLRFTGIQMVAGAFATGMVSLIFEAPWRVDWMSIGLKPLLSLIYLIVFGSIVGFSSYVWLSRNVAPTLVSTYALVNPVIAVILGMAFNNEQLTSNFAFATVIVLIGLTFLLRPATESTNSNRK